MARTVTLSSLRTWARQLADVENDPNVTDAELTALANRHLPEVYDLLVEAGPPDYYASSTTITSAIGTTAYALPADFRTLTDVYANETSTEVRHVFPMKPGTRAQFMAPTAVWTFVLEYIPVAPTLASASDTFDGVSGWEELVANLMARDIMIKRDADPSFILDSIQHLKGRIALRSHGRDRGHPRYTSDLDEQTASIWPSNNVRVTAYRLRAGNLELYEPVVRLP